MKILINNEQIEFEVKSLSSDSVVLLYQGEEYKVDVNSRNNEEISLSLGNQKQRLNFINDKGVRSFNFKGRTSLTEDFSEAHSTSDEVNEGEVVSPMPGKVFKVLKNTGDDVKKGETVIVLEAMKMEHEIKAPKDSKVKKVFFSVGDQVKHGDLLVELDD